MSFVTTSIIGEIPHEQVKSSQGKKGVNIVYMNNSKEAKKELNIHHNERNISPCFLESPLFLCTGFSKGDRPLPCVVFRASRLVAENIQIAVCSEACARQYFHGLQHHAKCVHRSVTPPLFYSCSPALLLDTALVFRAQSCNCLREENA